MILFTLKHNKAAYYADFVLYGVAVLLLGAWLLAMPRGHVVQLTATFLVGVAAWSLMEYLLHRFVLHVLRPFSDWHAAHHHRPAALICTPTVLSAGLIAGLVFLPAWLLGGAPLASALTCGVATGYLAYAMTHHAIHHWPARSAWLRQRKHQHALHHQAGNARLYGVTSAFWDHVFSSNGQARRLTSQRLAAFPPTVGGARHQPHNNPQLSTQTGTSP